MIAAVLSTSAPPQLALAVDPTAVLHITESRGIEQRVLRVGPLPEPQARSLAGFLLNRPGAPEGDGPWRCAVAGGTRTVRLAPPE